METMTDFCMMDGENIVLDIQGAERDNMTVDNLHREFKNEQVNSRMRIGYCLVDHSCDLGRIGK